MVQISDKYNIAEANSLQAFGHVRIVITIELLLYFYLLLQVLYKACLHPWQKFLVPVLAQILAEPVEPTELVGTHLHARIHQMEVAAQLHHLRGVYVIHQAPINFQVLNEDLQELVDLLGCKLVRVLAPDAPYVLVKVLIKHPICEDSAATEGQTLESWQKLSIFNIWQMDIQSLENWRIKLIPEMFEVILRGPDLMWKIVQYHLDLNHIIAWLQISPSEHGLYDLDVHVIWALLRNGVADHDVEGLTRGEEVLRQHIVDPYLQILV